MAILLRLQSCGLLLAISTSCVTDLKTTEMDARLFDGTSQTETGGPSNSNSDEEDGEIQQALAVEEDVLSSAGFCKDDILTKYLRKRYLSGVKQKRFRSRKQRLRWLRRVELKAMHHAAQTLTHPVHSYFGALPLVVTPQVEFWVRYFKTRGRQSFIRWLVRAESARTLVAPILKDQGVPAELFYLALIESGFNNSAYSRARATGPWQFVKGTAQMYGLKQNYWVDERRDPAKATIAAATYIRDLYTRFGDWYLAMAAYNAGPGTVSRAIRRTKSRDFWKIAKTRYLRSETKHYVPKVLAAIILGNNLEAHGFSVTPNPIDKIPVSFVNLQKPVKLREVASHLSIPYHWLKHWNPELIRGITPPQSQANGYPLRLPASLNTKFAEIRPLLSPLDIRDVQMHKVRRGETLSHIAEKYRISVRKILTYNPGLSPRRLRIGKKIAIPVPAVVISQSRPRPESV